MSGSTTMLLSLLFLCASARAEFRGDGYDGRDPQIVPPGAKSDYYTKIIDQVRKSTPQGSGESDADYAMRTATLAASWAPTAPNATAGNPDSNSLDRSEKLGDSALLAKEGSKAATASGADLILKKMSIELDAAAGGTPVDPGEMSKMQGRIDAYNKQSDADEKAFLNNAQGKGRITADLTSSDAGPVPPPTKGDISAIAAGLSDDTKKGLKKHGIDPEAAVERLLSGEVDKNDPAAVTKALAELSNLSPKELAKVGTLADTLALETGPQGDEQLAAANLRTGFDPEGKEGRGTVVQRESGKEKDVDNSEFHKKTDWLGGIPVSIMNREVLGYRIGDLLGRKKNRMKGGSEGDSTSSTASTASLKMKGQAGAKGAKGFAAAKAPTPIERYQLQDKGVTTLRKGSTIFQVAHRQYRDFSKWREKRARRGRVAQN